MDVGTLTTLAQLVLQVIDSTTVKKIQFICGFQSQLAKISDTVSTIHAVLLDAEEQERLQFQWTNVERNWLGKLQEAVYQADDLFDEVVSMAQRKELMSGNKVTKEVRLFFSSSNQLAFARNMSHEIKKIRERLDDISKDRRDFGLRPVGSAGESMVRVKLREDSHSFVHSDHIIGRDHDKRAVVDMLLDSNVKDNVYFVTIVGIGGLGKTSLAQLVYNHDQRIKRDFSLMFWVCVSEVFDVEAILWKVLGLTQKPDNLNMESLKEEIKEKIGKKKYLLVLDDVWNEDRYEWLKLRDFLILGAEGSRVVVTTRSKEVARIIGGGLHELKGLSPEKSWHLFEKMAFEKEEEKNDAELVEIGKQIVKKCASVPLAIKVVGSLLYGQNKEVWHSFKNKDLVEENTVIPILKVSYHHLASPLKSCFSYCALFPKGYLIVKKTLIAHWIVHGFIQPLEGKTSEEIGEKYFMVLLQRCFFHDIRQNKDGEIVSCKMHDLIHDVAKEVSGRDITVVDRTTNHFIGKTRHISIEIQNIYNLESFLAAMKQVRTFVVLSGIDFRYGLGTCHRLLSKARYLRVLDLSRSYITRLPCTIGKLLHIRYVDLSDCYKLKILPASLAELSNLHTLKLGGCTRLRELPRGFSKLVNLRHLDIHECNSLTHMPPRMKNLTSLQILSDFILKCPRMSQLDDLKALMNLRGKIEIIVGKDMTYDAAKVYEAGHVGSNGHLIEMVIKWLDSYYADAAGAKLLLKGLQPHPNLRRFELVGYPGATFPNWTSSEDLATSLPDLVEFHMQYCWRLLKIPKLSQLHSLRTLTLHQLLNLEYIESKDPTCYDDDAISSASSSAFWPAAQDGQFSLFPSLERLDFFRLPGLKGWRRPPPSPSSSLGKMDGSCSSKQEQRQLLWAPYSFPRLCHVQIKQCPCLTCIPLPANLTSLVLEGSEKDLDASPSSFFVSSSSCDGKFYLRLSNNLKSLSVVEKMFRIRLLSSLEHLQIVGFPKLKSLHGGGLDHLTNLTDLEIVRCKSLESLPECISPRHLRSLKITLCHKLKSLPEAICNVASLSTLQILRCPYVARRFLSSTGEEDWPKIQHIRNKNIFLQSNRFCH